MSLLIQTYCFFYWKYGNRMVDMKNHDILINFLDNIIEIKCPSNVQAKAME